MGEKKKRQRKEYDWEAIEREYVAGQLSISEISRQFGCTRGAIQNRAKKHGWKRDLTDAVRRETKNRLVAPEMAPATRDPATEKDIIEHAAAKAVEVIRQHRQLIGRTLRLAEDILVESDGQDPKTRHEAFKSVSQGLAKVIPLERQAFNIDDDPSRDQGETNPQDFARNLLKSIASAQPPMPNLNQPKIKD